MANTNTKNFLIYGMQRTGTNYTETLVRNNFKDVVFLNDYARALPTHKHFRLYDEKHLIPENKYMNSFIYNNFTEFDDHTARILNRKDYNYIVVIKNPYSWYLSYKIHARRCKYDYFKNDVNPHFILEYNSFYGKWLQFYKEDKKRILIIKYEDLIHDFDNSLEKIKQSLNLEQKASSYTNINKAPMSRRFNVKRLMYYKKKEYLNMFEKNEKRVINEILDKQIMEFCDYKLNI